MSIENDYVSIFEDDVPSIDFKLSKKYTDNGEINFKKSVIFEGKLSVRKKSGSFMSRFYQIIDKKIVFFLNNNTEGKIPLGYYDLLWFYKLDYNEYQENSKTSLYSFTLKKNGKYHEFFSTKRKKIKEWYEILRYFCINSGFAQTYIRDATLGKGHFATVYKVFHKKTKMAFAAKVLSKDKNFMSQKTFVKNEIYILKKLSLNDYITRLYEIYEDSNELVLIFELMEGGDLYEKIKTKKKYPEKEIFWIFLQIMKGLDYLHSKGIVHRDIKLQNMLLTNHQKNPRVKIADFSLAEEFKLHKMHIKCGTPGFMAPEIFTEEFYDEKVDIFSAGIILFILLSGRVPFKGKDNEGIIKKNKLCEIKYKKADWESVSKSARKLVIQMTNKNPLLRIQIPQILTSNFMMKYYYDDSIKEVSEMKKSNNRVSMTQSQKKNESQNKILESQGLKKNHESQSKMLDSQGQQGMTKFSIKNNIISLEEVEKQKKLENIIDKYLNFKESASSNSLLKPASMLDNTLKPPSIVANKQISSNHDLSEGGCEAFRSADSLFLSNDELSMKSGVELMSVTMRSSFSIMSPMTLTEKNRSSISYTQKLFNQKLFSSFSNSDPKKSKSSSNSKSYGSRSRSHRSASGSAEDDDENEDSIISTNKYYPVPKDGNPIPRLFQQMKVHFRETKPSKMFARVIKKD